MIAKLGLLYICLLASTVSRVWGYSAGDSIYIEGRRITLGEDHDICQCEPSIDHIRDTYNSTMKEFLNAVDKYCDCTFNMPPTKEFTPAVLDYPLLGLVDTSEKTILAVGTDKKHLEEVASRFSVSSDSHFDIIEINDATVQEYKQSPQANA